MPDSIRVSLTDTALATAASSTIPVSAGPGLVPTFTAPSGVRTTLVTPYRNDVLNADDPAYGVKGDGTTDDTVALRNVLATGLSVRLTPGNTYLISGHLNVGSGQVLMGQGATLKRINQVSTTTTTTITSGVTQQITVADASSFRVGMDINVVNGSTYDSSGNHTITAIAGNVITVGTTFNVSVSGTTTVYSNCVMVTLAADAAVHDLVLDGNKANQTWFHWEVSVGILMEGARSYASHCHVLNSPGEGVMMQADYMTAAYCVIETPNGNGIHLTGATNPLIHGCRIISPNQNQSNGHVMGCIGFSNSISDATISACYLYGGVAGIGAIDSSDNSDVTITGCTIRNATGAGIDLLDGTASNTPSHIQITGCRIYGCQYGVRVSETAGGSSTFPNYIQITGCYFDSNTTNNVLLNSAQYITITGCQFYTPSTSILSLDIEQSQYVAVSGCVFKGGGYGVYSEPVGTDPDSLNIIGNVFVGQQNAGVRFQDGVTGSAIQGNIFVISSGNDGVLAFGPTLVKDNQFELSSSSVGIQPNLGTATGVPYGCRCMGNTFSGTGTSIQPEGSHLHVLMGNISAPGTPLGNTGTLCTGLPQLTFSGTFSGSLQTGTGAITVNSSGSGVPDGTYSLIFAGGGGTGATGTATFSGGTCTGTNVTAGGSGYSSAPAVAVALSVSINNLTA